jgi:hypothetical protein
MSIRKPFCAIGLIFYVLIIAAFSKWQARRASGKQNMLLTGKKYKISGKKLARS